MNQSKDTQLQFLTSVCLPIPGSSLRLTSDSASVYIPFKEALQKAARESLRLAGFPHFEGWPCVSSVPGKGLCIVHEVEIQTSHTSWHDEVLISDPTTEQLSLLKAWKTIFDLVNSREETTTP